MDHIVATMTLDAIAAFVILLVMLVTLLPLLYHKEYLWNFSILQRAHFSNLVSLFSFFEEKSKITR
jgi:hypothetical protein